MRAFSVIDVGSPPEMVEIAAPDATPGHVILDVHACGLNFADVLMVGGKYQDMPATPFTLGLEAAGVVASVGAGVTGIAPGDRVAAFGGHGGLAERMAVPADRVLAIPDAMPFEDAAAFQIAYGTGHLALDHCARLRPGETLLVTGAAGGVGLTAVEIGKLLGARVIAQARGPEKLALARAAGADHLIDAGADLRAELLALGGVDVVYDSVGGDVFTAAFRATRPGGRLLPIGFAGGEVPRIQANHLLVKNLTVIGFYLGGYIRAFPDVVRASLQTLVGWYLEGRIKPHVGNVLPLERAGEGLELLRSRKATGKIVVTP